MLLTLWRIGTQTWMAFVIFMFGLTWPFGFLGQPEPVFLDPMIRPWIRAVWFGVGALMWAGILATALKMVLYDGAGFSASFCRKAEILLIEIGWGLFCLFYVLRIFFG